MNEPDNNALIDRLKNKLQKDPELQPKPPTFPAPAIIDDLGGLRTLMKDSIDQMEATEFQKLFSTVFGLNENTFSKLERQLEETRRTIRRLWILLGAVGSTVVAGINVETVIWLIVEFLKFIAQTG